MLYSAGTSEKSVALFSRSLFLVSYLVSTCVKVLGKVILVLVPFGVFVWRECFYVVCVCDVLYCIVRVGVGWFEVNKLESVGDRTQSCGTPGFTCRSLELVPLSCA